MSMSECCSFYGIVYPIRYGVSTVFHNERAICLTYFPHLRFHRLIVSSSLYLATKFFG